MFKTISLNRALEILETVPPRSKIVYLHTAFIVWQIGELVVKGRETQADPIIAVGVLTKGTGFTARRFLEDIQERKAWPPRDLPFYLEMSDGRGAFIKGVLVIKDHVILCVSDPAEEIKELGIHEDQLCGVFDEQQETE
jgi:hypothetical protein